jgi:membrane-associated protein
MSSVARLLLVFPPQCGHHADMAEHIMAVLAALSGWWVVGAVFGLTLAECALFFGFVFPAEIVVILAGALCAHGTVHLWQAITAAVLGAIIGDSIGYAIGSRLGKPFLQRRMGGRWTVIQDALIRHGAAAVFFGRFSAFLRAAIPSAAGAAGIPYRRFLFWNAIGGVVWGTGYTLLGYISGESSHAVIAYAGEAGWAVLAVATIIILIAWLWHRRSRRHSDAAVPPPLK